MDSLHGIQKASMNIILFKIKFTSSICWKSYVCLTGSKSNHWQGLILFWRHLYQIVGRAQFLAVVGTSSLFSFWPWAEGHPHLLEAVSTSWIIASFLHLHKGKGDGSQVSLSLHLLLLLPSRPLNFSQERFSTYKNPCDKTVPADIIQSHPFISRSVSLVTSAESPLPEGVAYSMYSSVSRIGAVNSYPLAPKDTPPEGLT